jgi:hypothetical protein
VIFQPPLHVEAGKTGAVALALLECFASPLIPVQNRRRYGRQKLD